MVILSVYHLVPVVIGFDVAGLIVDESDGGVLVPVTVFQQIAATVSVDVDIVNGTAIEQEGQRLIPQQLKSHRAPTFTFTYFHILTF